MENNTLPLVRVAPDVLREGWHQASEDVRASHPVREMLKQKQNTQWSVKMKTVQDIYGSAAAMRLRTERKVLSRYTRLPGLPSSYIGLDTLMGTDMDFDFEDVLNDPFESPEGAVVVHDAMEAKLNL